MAFAMPFRSIQRVYFDDLDALNILHNVRFLLFTERARGELFNALGFRWEDDLTINPDKYHVVAEHQIRYTAPVRGEGELSVERIGELWAQSQDEMLGDSVEVTEGYRTWWSYVPHFIASPGYVYAYAYGQLLALAVYGRYEEEGPGFASSYLELLSAGGSRSPEELGAIVGVDLADPGFWDKGLDLVERKLDAAEQAARDAGRI